MNVGVPKERREGERRVALVPESVKRLAAKDLTVVVEAGAGTAAGYPDADYAEAGAEVGSREDAWGCAVVAKVDRPLPDEVALMKSGTILVSMLQHLTEAELVESLAQRGVSALAMDWMPRITRAQDMDARSSMSTIQGYKAAVAAADMLPRFMPMLMTAAGTISPSRVLIIGAGVAGLSAIATARRLGAVVEAFDVRPATREQVESLGGRFVAMEADLSDTQDAQGYAKAQGEDIIELERRTIGGRLHSTDAVITTALIPGQAPPVLLTREMVETMRPGSVIVDLAAAFGGNCELTEHGSVVEHAGVRVVGTTDWESQLAFHASQMYARNVSNYLVYLAAEGEVRLDLDDEMVSFPLVAHAGSVTAKGGA